MKNIKKILIANRGEIAMRIIRTAQEMGIKTVAVYSAADRKALHTRHADEAYLLGPAPADESYLRQDKILEIARKSGSDAIHPGYGFLSENAGFANAVAEAGIIFIGPSPSSIKIMGSKLAAKEAVSKYDIPMIPGSDHAISNLKEAQAMAVEIGFPLLIKASAGGGGKGMRIVYNKSNLAESLQLAVNEASSAFGDGSVFIEKYLESPRHIEFQILADNQGHVIHLYERECSIQRRHQKVIEESPASFMNERLRKEMGNAAVSVAKACGYTGAGTVEFLLDDKQKFYFLEMNTRLQVEHPVTEMITGIDLVRQQIRVAEGKPLPFDQKDIIAHGHAIELRVYAENPYQNFMPDTGNLRTYVHPGGPGVRVDDGFEQGMDIPVYYDPMISKLIVWATNREQAMDKMLRAIGEYEVAGVATTLPFGAFVMQHQAFRSGSYDTHFVDKYFVNTRTSSNKTHKQLAALLSLYHLKQQQDSKQINKQQNDITQSNWRKMREKKR